MKNKKYLAFFCDFTVEENFNQFLVASEFMINKFVEEFGKIYIINVQSLKLFTNKDNNFDHTAKKFFKLPKNVEFFNPKNSLDFDRFMEQKSLVALRLFRDDFSLIKIQLLFKKYNIKQVSIANAGNVQNTLKSIKGFFWKGFLYKLEKRYAHKLIVLLSNLKIVPKIEIKFLTNSVIAKYTKKKNIFNYLRLSFVRETILVNSRSFDIFKNDTPEVNENQIVLLDEMLNTPQWSRFRDPIHSDKINEHYFKLTKLLRTLSNMFDKEIVICLHPKDNLDLKKKYFEGFRVVQHKTKENICKSFIVLFFESSAIIDAFLLRKKMITIASRAMDQNQIDCGMHYCKEAGIIKINIDQNLNFEKEDFLKQLEEATKKYSHYINNYIAPDDQQLGYKKMIKILKERYFN
jgi:hypothetical protein